MSEALLNLIRREVERVLAGRATTRAGLVDSYDPESHLAKVRFQPENTLSGWLPIASARSGNGAGIHFAPNVNDQVLVHFLEGDHETGVVGMRLYSDQDRPLNVPAGEMWLVDDKGSSIKLTNDGKASVTTISDLAVSVGGDMTLDVTGDLTATVSGDLNVTSDGDATITANSATLKADTVDLGDSGGQAVARVGDSVDLSTGLILTGSDIVSAA